MPAGGDPHPILRQLGGRIRARRLELGLSQERLAERAQIHRTYVPGIEAGRRAITVVVLLAIASALEVDASQLIDGLEVEGRRPAPTG